MGPLPLLKGGSALDVSLLQLSAHFLNQLDAKEPSPPRLELFSPLTQASCCLLPARWTVSLALGCAGSESEGQKGCRSLPLSLPLGQGLQAYPGQ